MMKHRLLFSLMIVLILASASSVLSQDANDSAAREDVLQAFEHLKEGYRFTIVSMQSQSFTGEDEDSFTTYTEQLIQGAVAGNGDYLVQVETQAGESQEVLAEMSPFEMAQMSLDGVVYVNFETVDREFADVIPGIEAGWQALDPLKDSVEGELPRTMLDNFTNITLPSDFPFGTVILSAVELEPKLVEGVAMRVFDLELDALTLMIRQMSGTPRDRLRMLVEQADFLDKSELSLGYEFWIGAENGLLYRGESVGRTYLPYLSEDEAGPPYDLEINARAAFVIWSHGAVDEIEIPAEVAALMREN